jgi:hypothetical protein
VLAQAPGPDALQRVDHRLAQELHAVAGEEHRDVVALVDRRAGHEEGECGTGRCLGPVGDVYQQLSHGDIRSRGA